MDGTHETGNAEELAKPSTLMDILSVSIRATDGMCKARGVELCTATQRSLTLPLCQHANSKLKSLGIYSTEVTDLSPLSSLLNFETVECSNTKISDLTPLSKCLKLE